uniref:O-fucosyltransferase family protein n=1 Tax=Anthurium amnicola TaxID=1678845 RepID=A0A1D1XVL0_9ARAE
MNVCGCDYHKIFRAPKRFVYTCVLLLLIALTLRTVVLSSFPSFNWLELKEFYRLPESSASGWPFSVRQDKFLEVPQIVWGLNNQKIAFARACLTARLLNRTLIMPSLSASLFYKETNLLEPIAFDKVFQFERFNSLCSGFVRLGRPSNLSNRTKPFELQKGSGRKWTAGRDLNQLKQCDEDPVDKSEVIRITGKNPFLWHDHWSVKEYAKIFECLVPVDDISNEASKVISKIRERGHEARSNSSVLERGSNLHGLTDNPVPYIAVHMRIEKDWMIHCKKLEQRSNINQICSCKDEIRARVANIPGLKQPMVVYLAVADVLLEDSSILSGWKEGLLPFEKKKLGVWDTYNKYPYLIKSAIDYEVCLRADVFVGNSFSTFSSLVVLERTQKLLKSGAAQPCGPDATLASYAYNILGEAGGPQRWMTDMSGPSLHAISYGTNNISCLR